ncbi:NADH-quinone oxidoreductase subunit L [Candidatus Symbiobacter mobilis]|uniref:NADH dehydrogenase I subunit L n=1 Tax=Candidatus Symbiobacter mobilis CR TaxID=946483 RepID=U5NC05_9BURK|nr:NADH-quinone oxidoreductase subunit L [Candidatus Symbiobacter mobilis]AGX87778.1 NADH dehydrogenase I subunit L [Candidatus Symbiobacter mobilis CR]
MSEAPCLTTLLLIPLLPLLASILTGVLGTQFGGNLLGRKACHSLTIGGVFLSFVLSSVVLYRVLSQGIRIDETVYTWMVVGGMRMEVGFLIDGLSALMMCVVSFVSLAIHIYTVGYMEEDAGYNRFFSYISLFTFAMLMLVMSNNFLQLFFGWEAVGLVSYLLIGFWYQKPSATLANMKAFLVNRVGDFGFILGIALLVAHTGTLHFGENFDKVEELANVLFPGTDWLLLTVVCIGLFLGAMGKSAQFPLHVWLPDSMEGPTPISALIHAATMVTAGIFMVARMSPIYEFSDAALNLVLVIGSITALFMGFLGVVQNDIKRVIAYSTLSQLGYMTVALGASAYSAAVFHLMTHAFFKALLFLAAGSVILGMHHIQDIRMMGGLRKYMPITATTFLLGTLALVGTPLFSGFYSKDAIILAVEASTLPASGFAYFAVLTGVFVTALYSFRLYFLVFHGKLRTEIGHSTSHDSHHGQTGHHAALPTESAWVVTLPLIMLAIPSVLIGYLTVSEVLFGDVLQGAVWVDVESHPAMAKLAAEFHGPAQMAWHALATLPLWLAIAGAGCAYYFYVQRPTLPALMKIRYPALYRLLDNKYYMDWINESVLAPFIRGLGLLLWKVGDRALIDGACVNGSWKAVGWLAGVVRKFQTGFLYDYVLTMLLGLFVLMTYFVWLQ